jgi:hypothetical protein
MFNFGVNPLLTSYSEFLEYAVKMLFESKPGMGVVNIALFL